MTRFRAFLLVMVTSPLIAMGVFLANPAIFYEGILGWDGNWEYAHRREAVTLSTGEVITNESCLVHGVEAPRQNQIFYQANGSARREEVDCFRFEDHLPALSVRDADIVYRDGDHVILKVESYIFERSLSERSKWAQWETREMEMDDGFLRSFIPAGDARLKTAFESDTLELRPRPRYRVSRFDPKECVMITERKSREKELPRYLVYKDWHLDLERTRELNGLKPPVSHWVLEIVSLSYVVKENERVDSGLYLDLQTPGTKQLMHRTVPLNSTEWTKIDYAIPLPGGGEEKGHVEVQFAFKDPGPDFVSFFLNQSTTKGGEYQFARIDQWDRHLARTFPGGLVEGLCYRVRSAK